MHKKPGRPDPVEIAMEVRRLLAKRPQSEIDRAVQEALRALREGSDAEDSVEAGRRAVEPGPPD